MNGFQKAMCETALPRCRASQLLLRSIFLETSARLGLRVIWIEMEHGFMTFADAVECDPDIIDVSSIETPEMSVEKK